MPTPQNKKKGKTTLHVLGYKDGNRYIAHCLDFDIVAEGATCQETKDNLVDLIHSYIHFATEKNLEQFMYHPAPKTYWDKFIKASRRKRIPRPQFMDPALFKISKTQIKNSIMEKKITTHA